MSGKVKNVCHLKRKILKKLVAGIQSEWIDTLQRKNREDL